MAPNAAEAQFVYHPKLESGASKLPVATERAWNPWAAAELASEEESPMRIGDWVPIYSAPPEETTFGAGMSMMSMDGGSEWPWSPWPYPPPLPGVACAEATSDTMTIFDFAGGNTIKTARIFGAAANDRLGGAPEVVAFGDVNGDWRDDVIIGGSSIGESSNGEVYVVYGRSEYPRDDLNLGSSSATRRLRILGPDGGVVWFGTSVACADVNGDALDDIIIGSQLAHGTAGKTFLILGSEDPENPVNIDPVDLGTSPTIAITILGDDDDGSPNGDESGTSVAAGDFNGDGFGDVAIGAQGADEASTGSGTQENDGQVYIIWGHADFSPGDVIDLAETDETLPQSGYTRILGDDDEGGFGTAFAVGDFNGDGIDDLAIGASLGGPNTPLEGDGVAYLIYGGGDIVDEVIDLGTGSPTTSFGETRILGDSDSNMMGSSLGSGDFNGDGISDLFMSAISKGLPERYYVVYGDDSGLQDSILDLSSPGSQGIFEVKTHDQPNYSPLSDLDVHHRDFGNLDGNDLNADGFADLMIGSRYADPTGPLRYEGGKAYIFRGYSTSSSEFIDLTSAGEADIEIWGGKAEDRLGKAVRGGGDIDLDGLSDAAISISQADSPTIGGGSDDDNAGAVAMLFGCADSDQTTITERFPPGLTPVRGIGGRLAPISRAYLIFADGEGPFPSDASSVTVTVTRNKEGIENLPGALLENKNVAGVSWRIASDRTGMESSMGLVLQYTDAEIGKSIGPGGFDESNMVLFSAESLDGPWTAIENQVAEPNRNIFIAFLPADLLDTPKHFAFLEAVPNDVKGWDLYD